MRELNKTLIDYCNEFFGEFVSDIYVSLRENNSEYQKLRNRRKEILDRFPNLREIIENGNSMELTKDEVSSLAEIFNIIDDMRVIQEQALFLKGMQESCNLLRKLKMLKD